MKNHTIITVLTLLLNLLIFITSCENNRSEYKKENTITEQTENNNYQCPMKCEDNKTYDKPGQCPVCNMDLEKIETTHGHEAADHNH